MSKKRPPARIAAIGGVHVRGTPLWIDATRKRELCVVTSVGARLPPAHARAVATPELAQVLATAGYKGHVLASPRDRWLGVGGERLQLVDAGAGVLAAAALVALADENVLVTGPLRAANVDWPRADHIVAHVPALTHVGETIDRIADTIAEAAVHVRCSVRVECLEVAAAIAAALSARDIACRGAGLVHAIIAPERTKGARIDLGLSRVAHARSSGQRFDVDSGLMLVRSSGERLSLRWFADAAALRSLVTSARPRRLTLVGRRDASLALETDVTWQAEPRQLALEVG